MYITPSFTRQGSQVRTLYHPPVISQLNQALTRNRSAFFTSKSSINTPYYYSYISTLVLLGFSQAGSRGTFKLNGPNVVDFSVKWTI
jgi:hypothetical protein